MRNGGHTLVADSFYIWKGKDTLYYFAFHCVKNFSRVNFIHFSFLIMQAFWYMSFISDLTNSNVGNTLIRIENFNLIFKNFNFIKLDLLYRDLQNMIIFIIQY